MADSRERVYVCQQQQDPPVLVFDRDGRFLGSWGSGYIVEPHTMYIGPDDVIYLADRGDHVALKLSVEGEVLLEIGNRGQPSDTGCFEDEGVVPRAGGPFNRPTRLVALAVGRPVRLRRLPQLPGAPVFFGWPVDSFVGTARRGRARRVLLAAQPLGKRGWIGIRLRPEE